MSIKNIQPDAAGFFIASVTVQNCTDGIIPESSSSIKIN